MGRLRWWLLLLAVTTALLAACGGSEQSTGTSDCGSVLRFQDTLYWGTGEHVPSGRELGTGEEPRCADVGPDASGPTSGAVREDLAVVAIPGVDPDVAVAVVDQGDPTRSEVYVQGSDPGVDIPPAVRSAIKSGGSAD